MKRATTIALAVAVGAVTLTGCATQSNEPGIIAVHYSGGETQAKKFKNCLGESERSGFDPGDTYYEYPTRPVTYDATGRDGSEADPIRVVSADSAEMAVPITVAFTLKTECEEIRTFHEDYGFKYKAYFEDGEYDKGWIKALDYLIGKPLDTTLDRIAQNYKWRDMWNDPKVKTQMEQDVSEAIEALVKQNAGGVQYFKDFSVTMQKPEPVNEELKNAIAREQTAIADARSTTAKAEADAKAATAKANADIITARAQIALAQAEAAKKRAEIAGYGGREAYLRYQCIQQGCNPYQPTYIWGGATP